MNEEKKLCSDCKTTKTPLWRTGPCGPRSLCNACGIRYRKRKLAIGNSNIPEIKTEKLSSSSSSSTCSSNPVDDYHDHDQHQHQHKMNESLKMRINDLGNQMVTHRSRSPQLKRQKSSSGVDSSKKYGEVEQAAALLMSLSCASVYA